MTPLVGNKVISLFNVRLEKNDKIIIKKGEICNIENVYFENGKVKIKIKQAGIETSLLESSFNLIIGGLVLAFAIGYGFASRDVLTNILSNFYSKK